MAKLNGPLGSKLRGKVGEVVAAKTVGGATAVRAYQPVVKNPNTMRQRVSRLRFATASETAAKFSEAIQIGYQMVAKGASMYPRNMFVRDIVPVGANVITIANSEATVAYASLQVSKKAGITVTPVVSLVSDLEEDVLKVVPSNTSGVVLGAGEKLGMVVAAYKPNTGEVIVRMADVSQDGQQGVDLSGLGLGAGNTCYYYCFYKAIPESYNDVDDSTQPWKYPSSTSATTIIQPSA